MWQDEFAVQNFKLCASTVKALLDQGIKSLFQIQVSARIRCHV